MKKPNPHQFVHKLFAILQDDENADLISWSQDGTFFLIKDKFQLMQQVLQTSFKINNYDSFVRQLNIYDFKKIDHASVSKAAYKHPYFKRGRPDLILHITR